jgi:DNA polymerase-3 subunit beta
MNITIAKDQLIHGLQAVQSIVGNRTTLPILSNVLLRAEDGKLELIATDLDVSISCVVAAAVHKPGSTTVPVKKFFGIVRELGVQDIDLQVDDKNRCSISQGASKYKIHGLAAEEFPPMSKFKEDRKITLDQKKVKDMLAKTAYAVSTDEARYVLNGINLNLKDHKLTMVATDGRRLALVEEEVDAPDITGNFILPTKAVGELSRLLTDVGQVEIQFTENQAAFNLTNAATPPMPPVQIITKLVEGSYPNYKQVIPTETKERIQLNREEFLHALRRAEILTSDKNNSVKITFGKNLLSITANTPEVGEGLETIAVNYQGKEMTIAYNPGFIIQPLNALAEHADIFFDLTDDLSPGVLRINGPFLYVVMPMRTT